MIRFVVRLLKIWETTWKAGASYLRWRECFSSSSLRGEIMNDREDEKGKAGTRTKCQFTRQSALPCGRCDRLRTHSSMFISASISSSLVNCITRYGYRV